MIKIPSLAKIHNFLRNYYLIILGIIFALLICLNALIYYQYVLAVRFQPEITIEKVTIDQETLQEVLDNVALREESLGRVEDTRYYDPFK